MATLKDIANRTGFSVAVVSRALNPHPDQQVAESTRRAIEEACRVLGYRRNHAASCLRRGRHSAIGIFLPGLGGELTARLLNGLTKVANACNFSCNISFGEDIGEYLSFIRQADSLQSVGIISYAPIFRRPDDEAKFRDSMKRFRSSGGEVLMLNQPSDFLPDVGSVCIDNYHSGRLAAEHLAQSGCKRFCLVASSSEYWQGSRRNAGFMETLAARHIPVEIFTVSGNDSSFSGMEEVAGVITGEAGIFLRSDYLAMGLYRELQRTGRGDEPGRNLKIIGHDDLLGTGMLYPSLSSIRPPFEALGEIAMKTMLNMLIRADLKIDPSQLKPQLIIRESSLPN